MEAAIRAADRAVRALGDNLAPLAGQVVEEVTAAVAAQIQTALASVQGDGYATLSADHATVAVVPPSAAWQAAQAHIKQGIQFKQQHVAALQPIYASITQDPAQMSADLAALSTIAHALQTGVQPTAAQQLIIDRVLVRLLVVIFGA